MNQITEDLLADIRSRFAQVDACPQQGPRVFFENAGGALTVRSVPADGCTGIFRHWHLQALVK